MKTTTLTPSEGRMFNLFEQGKTYEEIRSEMGISLACLHTHCANIRKKLKIPDLKVFSATKRKASPKPAYARPEGPTKGQLRVLRLLAMGKTYEEIARAFDISTETAANAASVGCQRAGITGTGHGRLEAIRAHLEQMDKKTSDLMNDPML